MRILQMNLCDVSATRHDGWPLSYATRNSVAGYADRTVEGGSHPRERLPVVGAHATRAVAARAHGVCWRLGPARSDPTGPRSPPVGRRHPLPHEEVISGAGVGLPNVETRPWRRSTPRERPSREAPRMNRRSRMA